MKFYGILYDGKKEEKRIEVEANGYVQADKKIREKISVGESETLILYREDEIPPKPERKVIEQKTIERRKTKKGGMTNVTDE